MVSSILPAAVKYLRQSAWNSRGLSDCLWYWKRIWICVVYLCLSRQAGLNLGIIHKLKVCGAGYFKSRPPPKKSLVSIIKVIKIFTYCLHFIPYFPNHKLHPFYYTIATIGKSLVRSRLKSSTLTLKNYVPLMTYAIYSSSNL